MPLALELGAPSGVACARQDPTPKLELPRLPRLQCGDNVAARFSDRFAKLPGVLSGLGSPGSSVGTQSERGIPFSGYTWASAAIPRPADRRRARGALRASTKRLATNKGEMRFCSLLNGPTPRVISKWRCHKVFRLISYECVRPHVSERRFIESAAFARRRSGVRIPSAPLQKLLICG